ncbi:MAG TPA: hypothetical protein VF581_03685 [Flavobacterium sp.]
MILQNKIQTVIQSNAEACSRVVVQKAAQTYVHFYEYFQILRLFM